MKETVNEIKPAYTYYLEANLRKINKMAKRSTRAELINFISTLIQPAADTYTTKTGKVFNTKKAHFLRTINSPSTDITLYCYNSVKCAKRTIAKYNNLPTNPVK